MPAVHVDGDERGTARIELRSHAGVPLAFSRWRSDGLSEQGRVDPESDRGAHHRLDGVEFEAVEHVFHVREDHGPDRHHQRGAQRHTDDPIEKRIIFHLCVLPADDKLFAYRRPRRTGRRFAAERFLLAAGRRLAEAAARFFAGPRLTALFLTGRFLAAVFFADFLAVFFTAFFLPALFLAVDFLAAAFFAAFFFAVFPLAQPPTPLADLFAAWVSAARRVAYWLSSTTLQVARCLPSQRMSTPSYSSTATSVW